MNSYSITSNDIFSYELDENSKPDDVYVYGEGSFGKVNLYQNTSDNNSLVVWKEINLKRLDVKKRNEAFQEVEILAMLDHPNIIAYFKHFIGDDTLYIELEYAKCGTLTNLIKQQKSLGTNFDLETVIWYYYQLTSAINYIHEMGIMHRYVNYAVVFLN